MFKKILLENSKRKKIYELIKSSPGFHLRELQRKLDIPLSSLEHHIDYMVRHQVIYKEREGLYARYFAEQPTQEELKVISALRHEKVREIVAIILEKKDVKFKDLKDYLNLPSSTLSYYLKYLKDHRILVRQQIAHESIYSIKNQNIQKALLMVKSSFTDKLVDKVLRTFMETDFKHVRRQTETDS
jgi:predicted transcriptional regulator